MIPNRGVHFTGFDGRPMAIDSFFEGVFCLANILNITNSTRDEVYDVGGSARDTAIGRVGSSRRMSIERVYFLDMCLANNAFRGTLKCTKFGWR